MSDRNWKEKYDDASRRIKIDPAVLEETKRKMEEAETSGIVYELVEHPRKKWYQKRKTVSRIAMAAACFCVVILAASVLSLFSGGMGSSKKDAALEQAESTNEAAPPPGSANDYGAENGEAGGGSPEDAGTSEDEEKKEDSSDMEAGKGEYPLYSSFLFARSWTKEQKERYVSEDPADLLGLNEWKMQNPDETEETLPVYLKYGEDEDPHNKIGEYPARTLEEAEEALFAGEYRSDYDVALIKEKDILETELVYDDCERNGASIPVYRFIVKVTEEEEGETKTVYTIFDVPAILDEWILWDA